MEDAKQEVAEIWGYPDWDSLWNTFYASKEAQEIIEDVSDVYYNSKVKEFLKPSPTNNK